MSVARTSQFVSFKLEGKLYGLDIRVVTEIHPNVAIVPVPLAPPHIRGLVNIRGQVVLVMDIAVIFGRSPRPVTGKSQIVILKTSSEIRKVRGLPDEFEPESFGNKAIGFLVDRIGDVVTVSDRQMRAVPPQIEANNARFIRGVANPDGAFQVILDAAELIRARVAPENVVPIGGV